MERGRPFPLFRGSPSRSILAWLSDAHLRRLMLEHPHEIREVQLGSSWTEFRQKIKEIRATGYYIGRGEIDKDLMGIGVPILRATGEVAGSLTTIFPLRDRPEMELARFIRVTRAAAADISRGLNQGALEHPKP
jgi:DNA-binding IclR family transcriptional regulator